MATDTFLKRRSVLCAAGAALLGGAVPLRGFPVAARTDPGVRCGRFVTAARIGGIDRAAIISGDSVSDFALPARAHAALFLPRMGEVLLLGRRPGTFAAFAEIGPTPREIRLVPPISGHRFAGHAAVKDNGEIITTELHEETAAAVAVLRDGGSGAVRAVWPLGGIEPHDVVIAGDRMIVALGGIERTAYIKGPALNAGHIESAIVEADVATGRLLRRHTLPADMASLSMRHLALAPDGETVLFGMQDQDRSRLRPLGGVLRPGEGIELLPLPADEPAALRFYIGSVAVDASGRYAAATSPKGGFVAAWSLASGAFAGGVEVTDVCGLTADASGGFWATSGLGDVVRIAIEDSGAHIAAQWHAEASFDNHLLRLT